MEWIPLYSVASKNLESDAPILRGIFEELQSLTGSPTAGYRFDDRAQFAMGWWFYTIHVKEQFVRDLVVRLRASDQRVKDEGAILEIIRERLKSKNSAATIKHRKGRSLFARYWTWLMR